jgi:ketosteroid isomerase-like protein
MPESSRDTVAPFHELQNRWMCAWRDGDRAVLEQILAPDFALTVSARPSARIARAEWLHAALNGYVCHAFEYRDMQVRELGDVAVVSSVGVQRATAFGVDRSGAFFLTDVWRRGSEGRWQVVARYSSHPEPDTASARALQTNPQPTGA